LKRIPNQRTLANAVYELSPSQEFCEQHSGRTLIHAYAKKERDDLTPAQLRALAALMEDT
jgi:hypothetical protein